MQSIRAILAIVAGASTTLSCSSPPQRAAVRSSADVVVELEHRFAATVAERGVRIGFLEFAADNGVLFRPRPVPARTHLEAQTEQPGGLLAWHPVVAAIAASGDLGYTTGPWTVRPEPGAEPVAFGHYVTVWQRGADGRWGYAVDHGIRHPAPVRTETPLSLKSGGTPATVAPRSERASAQRSLVESLRGRDADYSAELARNAPQALWEFATESMRLYRDEQFPALGHTEAAALLAKVAGIGSGTTVFAAAAASGDLGYTYGYLDDAARAGREAFVYLRIWERRDGPWKVVLDVTTALPSAAQATAGNQASSRISRRTSQNE